MSAIALSTAQSHLETWLAAELAVADGKSFAVAGRSYSNHDLPQIRESIEFWDRRVTRLSRGSGVSMQRIVVRD